jgi:hypothetical protein
MSRTRSEGGATVVREEAITEVPVRNRPLSSPGGEILCFPCPPLAESRADQHGSQSNPREESKMLDVEQLSFRR